MEKLLIVLVLMVGVIAIAQMMRVYEISSKLRGKKEEEISHSDNVFNANMMLIFMIAFYAFFFWLLAKYGNGGIGPAASEHGEKLDWLLNFNFLIIIIVFFLTNTLLFVFSYKYYFRPERRATWFPHSNRLELIWTVIPAVVLAIIIILGIRAWNDITNSADKSSTVIELYSKQFDWTARYAGNDNQLGRADFKMVNGENAVGVLTHKGVEKRLAEMRTDVVEIGIKHYQSERNADWVLSKANSTAKVLGVKIPEGQALSPSFVKLQATNPEYASWKPETYIQEIEMAIKMVDNNAKNNLLTAYEVQSRKQIDMMSEKYQRMQRHIIKLNALDKTITAKQDLAAMDDKISKELVLIKGKEYEFKMRSMDVIHSAYFPHFRAQMNTVPGMVTRFKLKPIHTTEDMKKLMHNDKFEYVLLCNKICGATHSNMQMRVVVVENQKEYDAYLATLKSFGESLGVDAAPATVKADTAAAAANDTAATAAVH